MAFFLRFLLLLLLRQGGIAAAAFAIIVAVITGAPQGCLVLIIRVVAVIDALLNRFLERWLNAYAPLNQLGVKSSVIKNLREVRLQHFWSRQCCQVS
jgi:hypothetical protein